MTRIQISLSSHPQDFFSELVKFTRGRSSFRIVFSDSGASAVRGIANDLDSSTTLKFTKTTKQSQRSTIAKYSTPLELDADSEEVLDKAFDKVTAVISAVAKRLNIKLVKLSELGHATVPSYSIVASHEYYELHVTEALEDLTK